EFVNDRPTPFGPEGLLGGRAQRLAGRLVVPADHLRADRRADGLQGFLDLVRGFRTHVEMVQQAGEDVPGGGVLRQARRGGGGLGRGILTRLRHGCFSVETALGGPRSAGPAVRCRVGTPRAVTGPGRRRTAKKAGKMTYALSAAGEGSARAYPAHRGAPAGVFGTHVAEYHRSVPVDGISRLSTHMVPSRVTAGSPCGKGGRRPTLALDAIGRASVPNFAQDWKSGVGVHPGDAVAGPPGVGGTSKSEPGEEGGKGRQKITAPHKVESGMRPRYSVVTPEGFR